jgi:hypothetical protein
MDMSFIKYVLLAVLGATAVAPETSGNISTRTYDAESVSQPRGGTPSDVSENKNASTSKKNTASSNKNAKKPAEKSKKNSGGTTTPPPK